MIWVYLAFLMGGLQGALLMWWATRNDAQKVHDMYAHYLTEHEKFEADAIKLAHWAKGAAETLRHISSYPPLPKNNEYKN